MRYKCIISSPHYCGDEYIVNTRSSVKSAQIYGRAEYGERVQVYSLRTGKLLSLALWDASTRRYYNACKGVD